MIQRFRKLSKKGKAAAILVIVLAGCGAVLGSVRLGKRTPPVPTIEVKRGEFLDSVQFRGEVKALKSVTISAPAGAGDLQIIKLLPDGSSVKAGDTVVEFDHTKTDQDLAQDRSSLKSADAAIDQAKAQARLSEEEDKTTVIKAGYDVESAKLEASKQEIVSKIEGEEAKLKLADNEQALREAKTKQASDDALQKATIESTVEASRKAKYDVERAERALAKMSVNAPSAGTISILQHWTGSGEAPYRAGDRAWPGASIAELPDASSLRISARVDETERGRLAPKQPVMVQLNSIPDRQFTGHIDRISEIASMDFNGVWPPARDFTLEIVLDQTDSRFKPGISGEVTVVMERVPDAITIPAQAMFQRSGQNVAYVWQGSQFEERAIEVSRRSGDKIMVAKGVRPGEIVALQDPLAKEQATSK
jgi:HlyD family secretion protein